MGRDHVHGRELGIIVTAFLSKKVYLQMAEKDVEFLRNLVSQGIGLSSFAKSSALKPLW